MPNSLSFSSSAPLSTACQQHSGAVPSPLITGTEPASLNPAGVASPGGTLSFVRAASLEDKTDSSTPATTAAIPSTKGPTLAAIEATRLTLQHKTANGYKSTPASAKKRVQFLLPQCQEQLGRPIKRTCPTSLYDGTTTSSSACWLQPDEQQAIWYDARDQLQSMIHALEQANTKNVTYQYILGMAGVWLLSQNEDDSGDNGVPCTVDDLAALAAANPTSTHVAHYRGLESQLLALALCAPQVKMPKLKRTQWVLQFQREWRQQHTTNNRHALEECLKEASEYWSTKATKMARALGALDAAVVKYQDLLEQQKHDEGKEKQGQQSQEQRLVHEDLMKSAPFKSVSQV